MNTTPTIVAAAGVVSFTAAALAMPPVFSEMSYEEALAASRKAEKLLIVKGTAEWCGPCKRMDRTTWVDDDVVAWIDDHAIAIQVDVDEQPDTAKELRIRAMPTTIVFRAGEEFDRVVGYRDADFMMGWFGRLAEGKTELDRLRDIAGDRLDKDGSVDIQARLQLASSLIERDALDEALDEYLWLWRSIPEVEPAYLGVRGSFMAGDMERLASMHEPAQDAFAQIRDELEATLKSGDSTYSHLNDWIVLNRVVGDEDRTIAWAERIRDRPEAEEAFHHVGFRIFDLLIDRGKWDLAGMVYADPVSQARQSISSSRMTRSMVDSGAMDIDDPDEFATIMNTIAIDEVSTLHAATLAAGREDDAIRIGRILLEEFETPQARLSLVNRALDAGAATDIHRQWLDEAIEMGAEGAETERIARELDEALRERSRSADASR